MDNVFDFNRILFINSYACNFNCPYCMVLDAKKNEGITPNMQFGLENGKNLIDFLFENSPYDRLQITFSGGEPLVFFKQFIKPMVLYIREEQKKYDREVVLDMFTNASLLTEDILHFFKEQNFRVGISYDGHCGQQYRDAKTQDIVEEKIKLALQVIPDLVSIASTFYKDTLPYIHDAFVTVANMGVKRWSFAIDTLSTGEYDPEHCDLFGQEIKKIWDDLPNYDMLCNTFDKIKNFEDYANYNKAIMARPNGEICIGTTVPILIPEKLFKFFTIGNYTVDMKKLVDYKKVMGDFHVHVLGKNDPSFCETCYVKDTCQNVKTTQAERDIRAYADPMHCLMYLIVSHIMEGTWDD